MANIDFTTIQTFTAAELLQSVEYAIASIMVGGQSHTIAGRLFNRANLKELKDIRDDLKKEVEASGSATGTMTALAEFGRQQ